MDDFIFFSWLFVFSNFSTINVLFTQVAKMQQWVPKASKIGSLCSVCSSGKMILEVIHSLNRSLLNTHSMPSIVTCTGDTEINNLILSLKKFSVHWSSRYWKAGHRKRSLWKTIMKVGRKPGENGVSEARRGDGFRSGIVINNAKCRRDAERGNSESTLPTLVLPIRSFDDHDLNNFLGTIVNGVRI